MSTSYYIGTIPSITSYMSAKVFDGKIYTEKPCAHLVSYINYDMT